MLSERQRRAHTSLGYASAGIAASVTVLYKFPPRTAGFYPVCPVHAYTGLLCPGCGATRALAALLHGHLAQALALNSLVTLLLPVVLLYCAETYRRTAFGQSGEPARPRVPRAIVAGLLVIAAMFTAVRNLP